MSLVGLEGVFYHRKHPDQLWRAPGYATLGTGVPDPDPNPDPPPGEITRDPARWPFDPLSFINISVGSGATWDLATDARTAQLLSGTPQINSANWSVSVGISATADPLRTVIVQQPTSSPSASLENSAYINIPNSLTATGGSDGWVSIIEPGHRKARELYAAVKFPASNPTGWSSRYPLIVADLTGQPTVAGRRASAVAQLAGLIRKDELAALDIRHGLSFAGPGWMLKKVTTAADGLVGGPNSSRVDSNGNTLVGNMWVWPANQADNVLNSNYAGLVAMGAIIGIPSTTAMPSGMTPEGVALFRAIQRYAGFMSAQATVVTLYAEPACEPAAVTRMRTDYQTKIFPLLRVMKNNHPGTLVSGTRTPSNPLVIMGGGSSRLVAPSTIPPFQP